MEENGNEVVFEMLREDFSKIATKLHQLFCSELFVELVCAMVDKARTNISSCDRSLCSQLVFAVYYMFLNHLREVVRKDTAQEPISFTVTDMGACKKSKVRHVGGSTVKKVLTARRSYVRNNIFTENSVTLSSVIRKNQLCELIEEILVRPYGKTRGII